MAAPQGTGLADGSGELPSAAVADGRLPETFGYSLKRRRTMFYLTLGNRQGPTSPS